MQTGPSIDPVTRRPRAVRREKDEERKAYELKKLRAQADRLQIQEDPVLDLLLARVQKRVDQLITDDPEAQGYVGLLNDMGREFNLAKRAAAALAERAGFKAVKMR